MEKSKEDKGGEGGQIQKNKLIKGDKKTKEEEKELTISQKNNKE